MKLDVGMLTHDLASIPHYARKVEALGYDCLWSAETRHDPFLPLAVAATVTSRIKLGTAIAVAFARSPMVLAHVGWDLAQASGGRFVLGLGSQVKGHNERRFSVKWEAPAPRMREVVLALRAIWDCWQNGTKLAFKGRHYRFDLMTPFFNPGPIAHPAIPIYIAGVNEAMCRVAGEVADGLHVHPFNSPTYLRERVRPAVEEGRRTAGRMDVPFVYVTSSFVVLGDTEEERAAAQRAVKQQIAFYASTRTYEPVLAVHGWQDLTAHLHRKSVEGDWQGMADLITDEMVNTYAVTGTYADIGPRLRERYAGLLDRTALYQPDQPSLDDPRLPRLVKEFNG
ncbi:MAG TPA: TIGR03617 family F420-dependent LLM class oxidoreductase [Candidatus Tectomicrobia bacterium]|nr:TIGR03617 family F420-dependent LLM class oxidoreductase [Candidatus Tectomicrobia bacterium]